MGEVVNIPGGRGGGEGSGYPTIEQRVSRLEDDIRGIKDALARIEAAQANMARGILELRTDVAFIKGRLQGMPSTWQLLAIVLMTWTLGTGLLFAVVRFGTR
jgi:hypothetical protein